MRKILRVETIPEEFDPVHGCRCGVAIKGEAYTEDGWHAIPCGHRLGYQTNKLTDEELALALLMMEG